MKIIIVAEFYNGIPKVQIMDKERASFPVRDNWGKDALNVFKI